MRNFIFKLFSKLFFKEISSLITVDFQVGDEGIRISGNFSEKTVTSVHIDRETAAVKLYDHCLNEVKRLQSERSVKKWIELCEWTFEIDGLNYYRFKTPGDLPINRVEKVQIAMLELGNRLTSEELMKLVTMCEDALLKSFDSLNRNKKMGYFKDAIFCIQEIKWRQENLMFHPDILIQMAALTIIEENENPFVIDDDAHRRKVEIFKARGGEPDFFIKTGIASLLNLSEEVLSKLDRLWPMLREKVDVDRTRYDTIHTAIRDTDSSEISPTNS